MAVSPELAARIRRDYPAWASLLDIPDVANLLARAANEGWDLNTLQANLYATKWWRSQSEAQRNAAILMRTDRGEYRRQQQVIAQRMRSETARLGIQVTTPEILWLSTQALNEGWDASEITRNLVRVGRRRRTMANGAVRSDANEVWAMAKSYGISVSGQWAVDQALKIASGDQTLDGVKSWMHQTAYDRAGKAGNEEIRSALKGGMTVWDALQPRLSTIAQELELSIDSLNLTSGLGAKILNYKDKDTGDMRVATDTEALQMARQDRRWRDTRGARQLAAEATGAIAEFMGVRA